MTNEKAILDYLRAYPGRTATQVAGALGLKPSTVSSLMHKMWEAEILRGVAGEGPRGGRTYYVKQQNPPPPTFWERL